MASASLSADEVRALTDEELCERFHNWRLDPATEPLPHNKDIEAQPMTEFEHLRAEVNRRGLNCEEVTA